MDHSAHLLATHSLSGIGLIGSLFVVGLAGSIAHCAAMCGPFVLAQVPATRNTKAEPALVRGALVPYHLGRLTTYTLLGAGAGGLSGSLAEALPRSGVMLGIFLIMAAALFLIQALKGLGLLAIAPVATGFGAWAGAVLARIARALLTRRDRVSGYALGVALGFLPCGLLYGALAAAAGTGSVLMGALAMAAFATSTVPALVAIGCAGVGIAQRWRTLVCALVPPLQAINAVVLIALAIGEATSSTL